MSIERLYDIMHAHGVAPSGVSKYDWVRSIQGRYELWPIMKCGAFIGGVLFIDNTVHIAIETGWAKRWATREMIMAYPSWRPGIDVHAPINKSNVDSIRLAKHLGFELTDETETHFTYTKRKHNEHLG